MLNSGLYALPGHMDGGKLMANLWRDPQWLEQMREVVDRPADEVVADVIDTHGLKAFNTMLKELINNRHEIPDALPKRVRDFFQETQVLPEWADTEKITQGEKVFILHGPEMIAMLFFVSLPTAYGMEKGSHVLAITAELTQHVHRRIFRTAQFITDVMQPGGLGPDGRGIRSAQKLRLLHASIRHYIAHHSDWNAKWNPDWGQPINQEDMASTLMDFSVGVIRGMQRIKVTLTAEEAEAYYHTWRVVGHILGIQPALLPETVKESGELADAILDHQLGPGEAGQTLTQHLIQFMQGFMPRPLWGLPAAAIRYLSGDRIANAIKSGPYNWTLIFLYVQIILLRFLENFTHSHPRSQKYIRFLFRNLMDKVVLYEEGGEFYFDIPPELRNHWHLQSQTSKPHPR